MKRDGEETDSTQTQWAKPGQRPSPSVNESRRAIAYSMDALIPGLYVWLGNITLRIGGSSPETEYSGTVHSFAGAALVLPGYLIYSTYHGSYDPR